MTHDSKPGISKKSKFKFDVALATELKQAARKAGATLSDIKQLARADVLAEILPALRGWARVVAHQEFVNGEEIRYVIDSGMDFNVRYHNFLGDIKLERRGDGLVLNGKRILLCQDPEQSQHPKPSREELYKLLRKRYGERLLSSSVQIYLFNHPELVPNSFKEKDIFFWGTLGSRTHSNTLYVPWSRWTDNIDRNTKDEESLDSFCEGDFYVAVLEA